MEIERDKYFVLAMGNNKARVAKMGVYEVWLALIEGNMKPLPPDCHCLNVSEEEARVFLKLLGFEDVTDTWDNPHR